ncbi:MAG: hypothetical protein RIQ53_3280 [Pseudomonadota bacterium]
MAWHLPWTRRTHDAADPTGAAAAGTPPSSSPPASGREASRTGARRAQRADGDGPPAPSTDARTALAALQDDLRWLQRLEWTTLRRLDGRLQGAHRTLWRGSGVDLAGLREYQHGDDARRIDWNASARSPRPQLRETTEDRELQSWLLIDASASLSLGAAGGLAGEATPLARARRTALLLAALLTRQGQRLGALIDVPGHPLQVLRPGAGRAQLMQLLARLHALPPQVPGAATDLSRTLGAARGLLRQRGLLVLLTDGLSAPGWGRELAALGQRHELLAVLLAEAGAAADDGLASGLPPVGWLTVQDAETGEQLRIDSSDPALHQRLIALRQARDQACLAELAASGADVLEVGPADAPAELLQRLLALRRLRARQGDPARTAGPAPTLVAQAAPAAVPGSAPGAVPHAAGARP